MRRAATASLGIGSTCDVFLRLPSPALQGNDGEQLGLCTPGFQDVSLWPAAWRKAGKADELLVGAECVSALAGGTTAVAAEKLFESAVGIVVAEVFYAIQDSVAMSPSGAPCAYRLRLNGPARD